MCIQCMHFTVIAREKIYNTWVTGGFNSLILLLAFCIIPCKTCLSRYCRKNLGLQTWASLGCKKESNVNIYILINVLGEGKKYEELPNWVLLIVSFDKTRVLCFLEIKCTILLKLWLPLWALQSNIFHRSWRHAEQEENFLVQNLWFPSSQGLKVNIMLSLALPFWIITHADNILYS